MKTLLVGILLLFPGALCFAEVDMPSHEPPSLFDHYLALQRMQQDLLARSPDQQTRLQSQMERAEREACLRLRQERREQVSIDRYRRQGGASFEAFVLQFERYCETRY